MAARTPEAEPLLTPAEVATMFRVDPKTVTRWAKAGKLTSIRTLGGHRRYRETEVRALLAGDSTAAFRVTPAALACQRQAPGGQRSAGRTTRAAAVFQLVGGSAPVDKVPLRAVFRRQEHKRCTSRTRTAGADPAQYTKADWGRWLPSGSYSE